MLTAGYGYDEARLKALGKAVGEGGGGGGGDQQQQVQEQAGFLANLFTESFGNQLGVAIMSNDWSNVAQSLVGSLSNAIGGMIGGPFGGFIGGVLGGLGSFLSGGRRKQRLGETPADAVFTYMVNTNDLAMAMLAGVKQMLLAQAGPGLDRLTGQMSLRSGMMRMAA